MTSDGSPLSIEFTITPIHSEQGEIIGLVTVMRDELEVVRNDVETTEQLLPAGQGQDRHRLRSAVSALTARGDDG